MVQRNANLLKAAMLGRPGPLILLPAEVRWPVCDLPHHPNYLTNALTDRLAGVLCLF